MTADEKDVLARAKDSNEGLISPATFINSYAAQRRSMVERLVAMGYVEMVPEEIHTGTVINFYRVTEKGMAVFYPWYKKAWFHFKGDFRTVIVSAIVALVTTLVTLLINYGFKIQ